MAKPINVKFRRNPVPKWEVLPKSATTAPDDPTLTWTLDPHPEDMEFDPDKGLTWKKNNPEPLPGNFVRVGPKTWTLNVTNFGAGPLTYKYSIAVRDKHGNLHKHPEDVDDPEIETDPTGHF